MKHEEKRHFVVSSFELLEKRLKGFMDYVPYLEGNDSVVSPVLTSVLLEACGLVESVFKAYMGDNKRRNLKQYVEGIEEDLELSGTHSVVLCSPITFVAPFEDWGNTVPGWWKSYNDAKHDRMNNPESVRYRHTIQAMAGLHQVISRDTTFVPTLLSHGWYNSMSGDVAELVTSRLAGARFPVQVVPTETALFVSAAHGDLLTKHEGAPLVDEGIDVSPRVRDILLAYEWLS